MSKMKPKPAGEELEPKVPADLRKALVVSPLRGSVEGSYADRTQRLYELDRFSQTIGDTEKPY